jgi:hypothetical protein
MENVDNLIRSSATLLEMTHDDYLHSMRHLQHMHLMSLKQAKTVFRAQLHRMQRVHAVQLRNMEVFAISAALKMFSVKAVEVRHLFQAEVTRLKQDYDLMEGRVREMEQRNRVLSSINVRQERTLVEVNQYFHHYVRSRKSYAATKELARASLGDLIKSKY